MSDIGYKKPPARHRWCKGQSGNPSGRPKKKTTFTQEVADIVYEPVKARTAKGRSKNLHIHEVSLMSFCKRTLQGTPPAFCRGYRAIQALATYAELQKIEENHLTPQVIKELREAGYKDVDGELVRIEDLEEDE